MPQEPQAVSSQLKQQLYALEKRDWELWILALAVTAILAGGFFVLLLPTVFLGEKTIHLEADLSPQLLLGFLGLVLLFIIYLAHKHIQIRKLRSESVVGSVNFESMQAQFLIDPLTKAFSRAAAKEVLGKEINRVQRTQGRLTFLYMDVDNFKQVNTRFGHLTGDLVLAEVGGLLKRPIRGCDYAIRLGGDEFLVVLVDTDATGAEAVKSRINQEVEAWNKNNLVAGLSLSLSLGIKEFDGSQSLDQVLAEADSRMYAEKKQKGASASG